MPTRLEWLALACLCLVPLLAGCTAALAAPYVERGIASWYGGARHHGRLMASGKRFNQWGISAAHKSLPFGTRVSVLNLDNGRRTDVVIEDRGPFIRGRVIDLSRYSAGQLGMIDAGTARVEIRVLRP